MLLFGSVARGDAGPHSDIDLVAVFDDIDYALRFGIGSTLSSIATAAAQCPVDVHVTDVPEWRHRTERVSSSFEAGIAGYAVLLVDKPVGHVQWDKEIGLPTNNHAEACKHLDDTSKALDAMPAHARPGVYEIRAFESGDTELGHRRRFHRMVELCVAASTAIETALKAMTAVAGKPTPFEHKIHSLLPLAEPAGGAATTALAVFATNTLDASADPYNDVTIWRAEGTYVVSRREVTLASSARLAPYLAWAAITVARTAATSVGDVASAPEVEWVQVAAAAAIETFATTDIATGAAVHPHGTAPGLEQ